MNHNPDKKFSADENCGLTHKQIEQMWGSPENIDAVSNFTRKLKKLDLSFEEIALLRGVVVLSRGKRDNSNISIMNSSVTSITYSCKNIIPSCLRIIREIRNPLQPAYL